MKTSVDVSFFRAGTQVGGPQLFNVVSADPDWTDWIVDKWESIENFFKATYEFFSDDYQGAKRDATKAFEDLIKSVDSSYVRKANVSFPQDGRIDGVQAGADEVQVLFQANSEDDLQAKKCFANVVPPGQVRDLGESRPDRFHYAHKFSLPLTELDVGHYVFGFGAADDGTFID